MAGRICVTFNAEESINFPDGLRAAEMELVRSWTNGALGNRQQFMEGIAREDTDALKALLLLLKRRRGDTTTQFVEVDFDFDALEAYFVDDDGRQIEPDIELDDDGDPVMIQKPGQQPRAKVRRNDDGSDRWVFTDTREPVPTGRPTKPRASENGAPTHEM